MDSLREAFKAAQAHYPDGQWSGLPPRMQTEAIYKELRRLDAEAARAAAPDRSTSDPQPLGSGHSVIEAPQTGTRMSGQARKG